MNTQTPSPVLSQIAYYQARRDEVPNQELAQKLAESRDAAGIQEIAEHLWDRNKNIQSDCLKVLYEIGYLNPELISGYAQGFLKLLQGTNNRLVWGAMIGLALIADRRADEVWTQVEMVMEVVEAGSVITTVWGVRALAKVAASSSERRNKILPFLFRQLQTCLPRDLPLHAESLLRTIDPTAKTDFLALLATRQPELSPAQHTRLKKVLKELGQ